MYTVKQLAELAGISVRTLHYYDEIGLLRPTQVGANGYRYYDDAAVLRLQQILLYREIGFELMQIRELLDNPAFEINAALESHRVLLEAKVQRLQTLIQTVDNTLFQLSAKDQHMGKKQLFAGFTPEKQAEYERSARLQYDPKLVNESIQRWHHYTPEQQEAIKQEGGQVYLDLVAEMVRGTAVESPSVQAIMERWHQHFNYFYAPTLDILRGMPEAYKGHPDFVAFYAAIHPDLLPYLEQAIIYYVDALEYAEIERLYAEDEQKRQNG